MNGIDVSKWQATIDFNKVKASGKEFVLIRAGYGRYTNQKDEYFESNYKNAKAAGLHVGAYWYSYAESPEDAKLEAKACMEVIKGKQFDMPVLYDFEEKRQFNRGKKFCSDCIDAFCSVMEAANYFVGLYIYRSALQNYVEDSITKKYALAVAEYGPKLNYNGNVGIWQYSSTGRVNGINGNVDLDICYVDYPKIIKEAGRNGYTKQNSVPVPKPVPKPTPKPTPVPKPVKKTVDELAREVIAGKWSAGESRRKLLTAAGYDYNAVQNKVNEILYGSKPQPAKKSIDQIAREVIRGDWGAGEERRKRLTAAGYNYNVVQKRVNELMR